MFDELHSLARLSAVWAKLLLSEYGGKLSEAQSTSKNGKIAMDSK